MSDPIDELAAHCLGKSGVTHEEPGDFKLLDGFLDTFARIYQDEAPPVLMVRCTDATRERLAVEHPGVVVSDRMHWGTEGWTWTDVPIDGSLPVETLLGLIDESHRLLHEGLDDAKKFLITLFARDASPAEALSALIEHHGLEGRRGEIESLARPALAIVTSEAGDDEAPVGSTRIGGRPDLDEATEWPCYEDGRPMTFLAQINLAEIPDSADRGPLPAEGLLSIFSAWGWQEEDDADPHPPDGDPGPAWTRIVYFPDASGLRRRPAPEGVNAFPAAPGLIVPIVSLPQSSEEPEVEALGWDEATWDAFFELLCSYDHLQARQIGSSLHHQMLGYASFIQGFDPAAGEGRRLLFQLGSDDHAAMCWGDGGCIYFFADADAIARGDFSRIHSAYQCG